ncbi:MAG: DUF1302 domain-containing protein [Gammaproteobacteria bacterium]|nr:DUF1302 domain-containing protein [Gammaproteobacteria bacterium]
MKRQVFLFVLLFFCITSASAQWENKASIKTRVMHYSFPEHSPLSGETYSIISAPIRLMTQKDWSSISAAVHYDFLYFFSVHQNFPGGEPVDDNFFDLTAIVSDQGKQLFLHRLDRLFLHYRGERLSAKFGRQALSWGHGLMFQVMDMFNPFSPVALDTDYKNGTDMLSSEWLFDNGDDAQGLFVPRREADNTGWDISGSSYAIKYHALLVDTDVDILVARHREEEVVGVGFARPVKQSMWRLDVVMNRNATTGTHNALVTNIDYSWVWFEHNFYGFVEYLYDEKGAREQGDITLIGKHLFATSVRMELHPLVNASVGTIANLEDQSGLGLFSLHYDWMQDFSLSGSITTPFGAKDSSFAGPMSTNSIFQLQLSAYF